MREVPIADGQGGADLFFRFWQRQAADDHGAGFRQQDRAVAIDLEGVVEPVLAGQHDLQHVAHAERGQGRLQRG